MVFSSSMDLDADVFTKDMKMLAAVKKMYGASTTQSPAPVAAAIKKAACSICGRSKHTSANCKFANKAGKKKDTRKCYQCQAAGHIARNCPNPKP